MQLKRSLLLATLAGCLALGGSVAWAGDVSVATLIGNLKSSDKAARLQAIDQLGAQGPKAAEAVAPLSELLTDSSAKVRAHAVCALGEIGAPAKPAVAAMAELLKDPDETVRRQVVKAVMAIHPGPKVTIPLCVKLLEDSDPGVRMRVLSAIADAGPKAVPGLIAALDNEKAAYWACLVLREIGPAAKDAVPALVDKLKDPRPEIRREVILTLAAMEEAAKPAVAAIAVVLDDKDAAPAATYALGRIGQIPQEAEATILANVKSDDKMLSTTSLWALARVHPEDKQLRREAGERLVERLKDQDAFVRVAAARALTALPPAPEIMGPIWEKAFQDADETTLTHALDALAALGPQAVPRLIDALRHEKVRGQVVYILGKIGPDAAPATDALAKLVADKNGRTAHEAILALANIGPGAKAAVPALLEALVVALPQKEDSNAPAIVYALGKIGPDAASAEPALTGLLTNADANLALVSAWALVRIHAAPGEIAAKVLPVLTAGLKNPLPLARQGAAEALGSLGPAAKDAVPALQQCLNDDDKAVGAAAAKAIELIGGGAAEQK